jgi:hypothetical protein
MDNLDAYEASLKSKGVNPYAPIPDNQTKNHEDTQTFIDTNSPEERLNRLINQRTIEPQLSNLTNESLVERITFIRENVFSQGNVRGEKTTSVRGRDVLAKDFYYPSNERVGEKYFPELVKLSDQLYDELLNPGKPTTEQIRRFCAVIYDMGILVHPYVDGNGQTFRLAIQSYINELSPEEPKKFLPYRIQNNDSTTIVGAHTDLIEKYDLVPDLKPFSEIILAQDLIGKAPTYDEQGQMFDDHIKWLERARKFLNNPNLL